MEIRTKAFQVVMNFLNGNYEIYQSILHQNKNTQFIQVTICTTSSIPKYKYF
uniref:Uncharacterized protein n=1 Tax=Arundo donax TaxID=35708 RepID=A0A0A9HGJ6_ARUDO